MTETKKLPKINVYRSLTRRRIYTELAYDFYLLGWAHYDRSEGYKPLEHLTALLSDRYWVMGRTTTYTFSTGPTYPHFDVHNDDLAAVLSYTDPWVQGDIRDLDDLLRQLSDHNYPTLGQRQDMTTAEIRSHSAPALIARKKGNN